LQPDQQYVTERVQLNYDHRAAEAAYRRALELQSAADGVAGLARPSAIIPGAIRQPVPNTRTRRSAAEASSR
jgi:hypothetical protein